MDSEVSALQAPKGPIRWEKDFNAPIEAWLRDKERYDLRRNAYRLRKKRLLLVGGLDDPEIVIEKYLMPLYRVLRSLGTRDLRFVVYQDGHSFKKVRPELAEALVKWTGRR